ncbi:hypothetical protein NPIL_21761 [Nephila pilipes]|uniref:Uncharacterized protein n=1 Tax=Nephila pilipes TaxID=299642 RepID=A0A8X6QJQ5_NEPPI|nr:hypothetical protein NPIL_21761 [Nephila pilipes]
MMKRRKEKFVGCSGRRDERSEMRKREVMLRSTRVSRLPIPETLSAPLPLATTSSEQSQCANARNEYSSNHVKSVNCLLGMISLTWCLDCDCRVGGPSRHSLEKIG